MTMTITSAFALGSLSSRLLPSPCNIPSTCTCSPVSSSSYARAIHFRPVQAIISSSVAAASGAITPRIGYGSLIQIPQTEKERGKKNQQCVVLKAAQVEALSEPEPALEEKEKGKVKVVVKTPRKQRVVLKFIWLEKNIGLALDQVVPGHGTISLSPYYFWPRKDAWEELKAKLESISWVSQKRTIILLNQATDIINLWQQVGSNI
uniref:30S ribosomal protein 3, chloroplastic n=1 Tax=Picea sitchensis TaxID=3332 RepID=A9NRX5_PICSI|nr:unknown [Picea sitchensis]ABK23962.1 unknown [Picea sitchensis]